MHVMGRNARSGRRDKMEHIPERLSSLKHIFVALLSQGLTEANVVGLKLA